VFRDDSGLKEQYGRIEQRNMNELIVLQSQVFICFGVDIYSEFHEDYFI
jgi:hypothetical protein